MIIGLNAGHTLNGVGTSANGVKKESDMNRLILKRLTEMLKDKGHTVVNCTIDKSNNDLADACAVANKQKLDLFLSLHLNAFADLKANGVETFSISNSGKGAEFRNRIQAEMVNRIGWYNRGNKTANFYVLKNTVAPAVLVELGFCTNQADMDKWNTENICKGLFKAITGVEYVGSVTPPTSSNGTCEEIHRVKIDGIQVGAYKNHDSVANVVKDNLGKNIEIK